jgi:Arc/MetJ family transcription regulator
MRKIDVPWMWRNVRTFRHVAEIAEVTTVYDFPVACFVDSIELASRALIDEIEETRESRTQIDAPPAAVADAVDALELTEELTLVVKLFRGPVERVARGRLEATLSQSHGRRRKPLVKANARCVCLS